jgi:hypothetical protein
MGFLWAKKKPDGDASGLGGYSVTLRRLTQEADVEEKMHWLPTSIGMAVLACIFGGIAIGIYPGWESVGEFLKNNVNINWDQNAPAWVQAIVSVITVATAFAIVQYQLSTEHKRLRASAAAKLNTFAGALASFQQKFPENGDGSLWDVRTMTALLNAEIDRSNSIPLEALSLNEQRGVFAFRLAAYQIMEGLKAVVDEVEIVDGNQYLTADAYAFLLHVISQSQTAIGNGRQLLSTQISASV